MCLFGNKLKVRQYIYLAVSNITLSVCTLYMPQHVCQHVSNNEVHRDIYHAKFYGKGGGGMVSWGKKMKKGK